MHTRPPACSIVLPLLALVLMLCWTHAHINKLPVCLCLSVCLPASLLHLFMSLWSLFLFYYASVRLPSFSVFMSDSSPIHPPPFILLCSVSWAEQLVNVPSTPGVILAQPTASACLCLQHCVCVCGFGVAIEWGCWANGGPCTVSWHWHPLDSPHLFSLQVHSTIAASPLSGALVNSLLITTGKDPNI